MELNAILHIANMDKGPREAPRESHSEILTHFHYIADNLEHCFAEPTPSGLFSAHITSRDMWLGLKLWTRGFLKHEKRAISVEGLIIFVQSF